MYLVWRQLLAEFRDLRGILQTTSNRARLSLSNYCGKRYG
jgi:hypothetical protein